MGKSSTNGGWKEHQAVSPTISVRSRSVDREEKVCYKVAKKIVCRQRRTLIYKYGRVYGDIVGGWLFRYLSITGCFFLTLMRISIEQNKSLFWHFDILSLSWNAQGFECVVNGSW